MICVHMCIYQIKCLYRESLTDKSQFINAVPTSGGTLIIPSRATRLRNNFFFSAESLHLSELQGH